MGKLGLAKVACIVVAFCVATAIASSAQTFNSLASFNTTGGYTPNPGLVQGFNGNFYGTTYVSDSSNGLGTVFEFTASGTLTSLASFNYNNGAQPVVGLVQASNGNLYGTTSYGGTQGAGTIFEVTPAGTLTALYNFCSVVSSQGLCGDGLGGEGMVQASNGNFYGTTSTGGDGASVGGTVFEITPAGKLTTLYSFCPNYPSCGTDGMSPRGLVQATNGNFYGTTDGGGANNDGTVFEITPAGKLTTLYTFTGNADGRTPLGTLVQAANGNIYGTTSSGGNYTSNGCTDIGCGTIFKITPAGTVTTVHTFDGTDGRAPLTLVQATNGNFYGVCVFGPTIDDGGTIFEMTPAGTLTTLHTFNFTDGAYPNGLVQATNGNFYGTTGAGGANEVGSAFSLSVGLGPFVETLPTSAKVGRKVVILGNNLTGATAVTFNGTAAKFTVVSGTEITAAVPTGATSGKVKVVTPNRTLTSNVQFRITQ